MKILATFILTINVLSTFAQQDPQTAGELNFTILNSYQKFVEIEMQRVSSLCWTASSSEDHNKHDLTDLFQGGGKQNSTVTNVPQFYLCTEHSDGPADLTMGLGLYSFTIRVGGIIKDYFEIDYRTSSLPESFNYSGSGDVNLEFDVRTGKIYYGSSRVEFPTSTAIWIEKPWITDIKTELEPLAPLDFEINSYNGNPHLNWNASDSPDDYVTNYVIYRSLVSGQNPPSTFSRIATIPHNQTDFIDYELSIGGPVTAYYKVTALNGLRESAFTPTLNLKVGLSKETTEKYICNIEQNYPNPFNPTTQIKFSLAKETYIKLTVFNTLGQQVSELFNGILKEGSHDFEFSGSELPTGIYYCKIEGNDFNEIIKMLLVK